MHNIESYSKYLHQLVRDNKFENVLINFNENAANFAKDEIAKNSYLVGDILRCYKEQSAFSGGLNFLTAYDVDIFNLKDSYPINQYGWLLHSILKNAGDIVDSNLDAVVNLSIEFLSRISFLEENNSLLVNQLFSKIIAYEKRRNPVVVDNLLKLLKNINIKHEQVKKFIASQPYLVSGIMDVFRKSNHVERALGFLKFLSIQVNANVAEQVLNAYGWCLYTRLKSEINDTEEDDSDTAFDSLLADFEEPQTNEIIELHPTSETLNLISNSITLFSSESEYSPFSRLFNLSLKTEKQKSNPNWPWMERFLVSIKEKPLSQECDTIQFMKAGRQKIVELASDFETWHSYYSLALLKQRKYQECIEISKAALFSIAKFHYNNDLWFARKVALSNKGLGNIHLAIKEMEDIEKRKHEWFIQKELAELYYENNESEKARVVAVKAALSFGEKEKKDGLFFLLGQILLKAGDKISAYKHFLLAQLIRSEQDWSVPHKLKMALEETFVEGAVYENSNSLYKELLKSWKQTGAVEGTITGQKELGKILNVNATKQIGTILDKKSKKYFFHFNDFKDSRDNIRIDAEVQFKSKPPKNNQAGMNRVAFDIRIKR